VERLDTSQENADCYDVTNQDQEEKEDKETEEISVDKEEGEATGETSKVQEMMVLPLMHKLPKSLDRNPPTNHKSMRYKQ
jgi:hypothetical protein